MRHELTGRRDLTFSAWHRRRFGDDASAIDVDLVGYCTRCARPLYAIEATRREDKSTRILVELARRLDCPALLVRYDELDGDLVGLRAHYARPIDGRRTFVGHEAELVELLLHLRLSHRCEATP
jgi:hypothetical protein